MKSSVSLTYEMVPSSWCVCLQTQIFFFSVGLLLPLTIGVPVILSLWIFGRKYQAGVVHPVGMRLLENLFCYFISLKCFQQGVFNFINVVSSGIMVEFYIKCQNVVWRLLLYNRCQAIIWTSARILINWSGTNFNEILIEIHTFSFKEYAFENVVWKMSAILSQWVISLLWSYVNKLIWLIVSISSWTRYGQYAIPPESIPSWYSSCLASLWISTYRIVPIKCARR